jgi:hypothetical protein
METLYLVSESQLEQIQGKQQQSLTDAVIQQDRPEAMEVIALDRLAADTLQRRDLSPWAKAERLANNLQRFVQLKPQAFPDPEKFIPPPTTTLDESIWEPADGTPWEPSYSVESPIRTTAKKPEREQTPRDNLFGSTSRNVGSAFKNVQSRRIAVTKKTYSPDIGNRIQPARDVKLLKEKVIVAINKKRGVMRDEEEQEDNFSTPLLQNGRGWITI